MAGVEAVNRLHVPRLSQSVIFRASLTACPHCAIVPLQFLNNVQAAVYNELVHLASIVAKVRIAVASLSACAKLVLEERIIFGANNGKVEAHVDSCALWNREGAPKLMSVEEDGDSQGALCLIGASAAPVSSRPSILSIDNLRPSLHPLSQSCSAPSVPRTLLVVVYSGLSHLSTIK